MANFNTPPIPANDPNYDNYFRPAETPRLSSPVGSLLEGVGNLFKSGVTAGDQFVKQKIKSDVQDAVGIQREADTQSLAQIRDGAQPSVNGAVDTSPDTATPDGSVTAPTEFSSQNRPLPPMVQAQIGTAQTLTQANQMRRMGDTEYYNRMTTLAQAIKQRYPTYSDEIDTEFSKLLGVNPANAYRRSLQNDIAAQQSQNNSTIKWMDTNAKYIQTIFPGADRQWVANNMAEVQHRVDMYKAKEFQISSATAELGLKKAQGSDVHDQTLKVAQGDVDNEVRAFVEGSTNLLGLKQISENVTNLSNGKPNPQLIQNQINAINALKAQATVSLTAKLAQPQYSNLTSQEKANMREEALKPFDEMHKLISDGNGSLAGMFGNMVKMSEQADVQGMRERNPKLRSVIATLNGLGPAGATIAQQLFSQSKLLPDIVNGAINTNLSDIITNPNPDPISAATKRLGNANGGTMDPRATRAMVDKTIMMGMDSRVAPEVSAKALKTLWDAKFFSRVPGPEKSETLLKLANPEMSKRVEELGHSDPTIVSQYQAFVAQQSRSVFGSAFADLSQFVHTDPQSLSDLMSGAGRKTIGDSRFTITFDQNTHRFVATPANRIVASHGANAPEVVAVQHMNRVLDVMTPAFSLNGADPTEAIQRMMAVGGIPTLNPRSPTGDTTSVPAPYLESPVAAADKGYQDWVTQHHLNKSNDYDLYAAYKAGLQPDANGHLKDTYKLPNHITFSNESIYSGKNGNQGGQWQKMEDGTWSFTPGPTNLKHHSVQELQDYFSKYEKGNKLILPQKRSDAGGPALAYAAQGRQSEGLNAIQSNMVPTLQASPGRTPDIQHVDQRLVNLVSLGAKALPDGYRVTVNDGYNPNGHVQNSQHHQRGQGALDIQIWGPDGKKISNRGEDSSGMYTKLAQAVYAAQAKYHPELNGQVGWGGRFETRPGSGVADLMHFDLGGDRGHLIPSLAGGRQGSPQGVMSSQPNGPLPELQKLDTYSPDPESLRGIVDQTAKMAPNGVPWQEWGSSNNLEDNRAAGDKIVNEATGSWEGLANYVKEHKPSALDVYNTVMYQMNRNDTKVDDKVLLYVNKYIIPMLNESASVETIDVDPNHWLESIKKGADLPMPERGKVPTPRPKPNGADPQGIVDMSTQARNLSPYSSSDIRQGIPRLNPIELSRLGRAAEEKVRSKNAGSGPMKPTPEEIQFLKEKFPDLYQQYMRSRLPATGGAGGNLAPVY